MADVRVGCIKKSDPKGSHEHITHIGNSAGKWVWVREKVIRSIETGTNTFYVTDSSGKRSDIGVVYPKDGRAPYLRTYADGVWNDNLLLLDTCPISLTDI